MDGHRLEYSWHGPGPDRATTLVFLHHGIGCASTWRDFPAALAEATGCGALVYSRAGYGGSDEVALPRPLTYMHHEGLVVLRQVLDAAGVRSAILVGHSDGGSIALLHASTPEAAPRVRGLVLEAPHVFVEDCSVRAIESCARRLPERRSEVPARAPPRAQRQLRLLGLEPGLARSRLSQLEPRGVPAVGLGPGAGHPGSGRSVRHAGPGGRDRARLRRPGRALHPGGAAATPRTAIVRSRPWTPWPASSAGWPDRYIRVGGNSLSCSQNRPTVRIASVN